MELSKDLIEEICRRLGQYDTGIVEIVQFGSSLYAPEHARDVDLLVFTKKGKEYGSYLDCFDGLDIPFGVDVVVKGIDEPLERSFATQVLGAHQILFGDGKYLRNVAVSDPTFDDPRAALEEAYQDLQMGPLEDGSG